MSVTGNATQHRLAKPGTWRHDRRPTTWEQNARYTPTWPAAPRQAMSLREIVFLSLGAAFIMVLLLAQLWYGLREVTRRASDHAWGWWQWTSVDRTPWWAGVAAGLALVCFDLAVGVVLGSILGVPLALGSLWLGARRGWRLTGEFEADDIAWYPQHHRPVEHPAGEAPEDLSTYAPERRLVWRNAWLNLFWAVIMAGGAWSLYRWLAAPHGEWGFGGLVPVVGILILGGGAVSGLVTFVVVMARYAMLPPDTSLEPFDVMYWWQSGGADIALGIACMAGAGVLYWLVEGRGLLHVLAWGVGIYGIYRVAKRIAAAIADALVR
jgi:hypothetical protein